MTALRFGTGWRDTRGRERELLWLSDIGCLVLDGECDVGDIMVVVRRHLFDEIDVRTRLLEWESHVDDHDAVVWLLNRLYPGTYCRPDCVICQGEGWVAGPDGQPVFCGCVQ